MFDRFFPKTVGTDPIVKRDGSTYETVDIIEKIVLSTLDDTKKIAAFLLSISKDWEDFLKKVFWFHFTHYQYEIDEQGKEQLRRPARSWKDRKKGIDCDCFTISVLSYLINGGLKHKGSLKEQYARIVKMYKRDYFQHIYVTVPKKPGADMRVRSNYWVLDPVLTKFNEEAPEISAIAEKKITMNGLKGIDIQYLNGTDTTPINVTGLGHIEFGHEFDGLGGGLGDTEENFGRIYHDFLRRRKMQLINTRNYIRKHPHMVRPIYQPKLLAGAIDQLLGVYDNPEARERMLEHLSSIEESFLQPELQGLGNLIHSEDEEQLYGLVNETMEGLGRAKKRAGGHKKAGFFRKHKNVDKAAKKGRGKRFLKKLAKGILQKFNPAFITIRAGFLAAMKTNALRIASRVYWATQPREVAIKAGVSASFYDRAVKGLEFMKKMFVKKLGGQESKLLKAITTGRAGKIAKKLAGKGKLTGVDELQGITGLGVVTAAAVSTAMTFLTSIAAMLKKLMGKKGDDSKEESETGGEAEATDPEGNAFSQSDVGPTAPGDNSQQQFVRLKNQSGNSNNDGGSSSASSDDSGASRSDDESEQGDRDTLARQKQNASRGSNIDQLNEDRGTSAGEGKDSSDEPAADGGEEKKGMGTGAKVGLALLAAGVVIGGAKMMGGKKTKPQAVAGPGKKKPAKKKAAKAKKVSLT